MFRSEVEEWLYSIGLEDLYDSFLEDGFNSLEAVRHMRQSDIDAIVDRRGYMNVLNEEIDKLNYGDSLPPIAPTPARESASRARSYFDYEPEYEDREKLIFRYESRGIPAVGFASRHLARRAKSTARKTRGTSVSFPSRSSVERYVPNSASQAFESLIANRRAASVAANLAQEAQYQAASAQLLNRQQQREEDRQRRAKTGKKIK